MKMRAIILAAGQGTALDGTIKCLIKHPQTGMSALEHQIQAFQGCDITVVAGYKAIEIMQTYPSLHYEYNADWALTNNAYSLGLTLDERPCYVMSGDFFFAKGIQSALDIANDSVLLSHRENRCLTAINCISEGERLRETYIGPLRNADHGEAVGVFKISDPALLRAWKSNCLRHSNLFIGQTLPLEENMPPISVAHLPPDEYFYEVNTVFDYMALLDNKRDFLWKR